MSLLSGVSEFFGLDIGTTAIRVVQLNHNKQLINYAMEGIESNISSSDSKADQQKLAQCIQEVLDKAGITTKNVAVGIPSNRVFTTVVDIDNLSPTELGKSIRYQADSIIPTPLEESKIDWAVIGDSPTDKDKVEVLISSVPNKFVEDRLDVLEAIGLNVIAFEPDNLAITRSMLPPNQDSTQMVLDIGSRSTDLVVNMKGTPRLTRAIPTGSGAILKSAQQNLNIDEKQAQEFVFKFGLSENKLEGQVYHAIISTVDLLITDIDKSIKYFESRYQNTKIERIVMTGAASALPEFPLYIANKFNINVEIGNAWSNVHYDPEKQNELLAISNHFGVAVGLAERDE